MAHEPQELRAHPLDLVERREVLQGDHHRPRAGTFGIGRRGVDQRSHAPPVRNRKLDLLRAHGLGVRELQSQRQLRQRHLAPVRAAADDDLEQLLQRPPRRAQALYDPLRLPVGRHHPAALPVEDHHSHWRGLDQGFEIGPRALLAAMRARVRDRRRGL